MAKSKKQSEMGLLLRHGSWYITNTPPYEAEGGLWNEYGEYRTKDEAREDLRGVVVSLRKINNTQRSTESLLNSPGALRGETRVGKFNGIELRVKGNEVYRDGKRVAVYKQPPTDLNLLRLASHLLSKEEPMATKTTTKKSTRKSATKKSTPAKARTTKSAKKGVTKAPATKKSAKSSSPSSNGSAGAKKKDGLRAPQVRILQTLAKAKGEMSRKEISEKSSVDNACCTEYIGSPDSDKRYANDEKMGWKSLVSLGLVKIGGTYEGDRQTYYQITAAGKKAAASN